MAWSWNANNTRTNFPRSTEHRGVITVPYVDQANRNQKSPNKRLLDSALERQTVSSTRTKIIYFMQGSEIFHVNLRCDCDGLLLAACGCLVGGQLVSSNT